MSSDRKRSASPVDRESKRRCPAPDDEGPRDLDELLRTFGPDADVSHIDHAGTAGPLEGRVFSGHDMARWPAETKTDVGLAVVVVHSADEKLPVCYPIVDSMFYVEKVVLVAHKSVKHMPRLEIGDTLWRAPEWSRCGDWLYSRCKYQLRGDLDTDWVHAKEDQQ